MLAQVEAQEGIEAAWIDWKGKLIRVRARAGTDVGAALQNAGLDVEPVRWHTREETIRFSEHEAKVLAERIASKVPDPREKLRELLERRILEAFRKHHASKDAKALIDIDREGIVREAGEFLTVEQLDALKLALKTP